jgi:hypothetical protein
MLAPASIILTVTNCLLTTGQLTQWLSTRYSLKDSSLIDCPLTSSWQPKVCHYFQSAQSSLFNCSHWSICVNLWLLTGCCLTVESLISRHFFDLWWEWCKLWFHILMVALVIFTLEISVCNTDSHSHCWERLSSNRGNKIQTLQNLLISARQPTLIRNWF